MKIKKLFVYAPIAALSLTACSSDGDLDIASGVGVNVTRSGCPIIAVPDGTGDVTLFDPVNSFDASAIDITANITNLRSSCNSEGERIYSEVSFEVRARRSNSSGARSVTLPYFSTVVQGGNTVIAKRLGQVTLNFADGEIRTSSNAKAGGYVNASAARLPEEVVDRLTRKRKAGDADAALDPLADPAMRAAVLRSTFELLVGFQLTEDQLKYNVTR